MFAIAESPFIHRGRSYEIRTITFAVTVDIVNKDPDAVGIGINFVLFSINNFKEKLLSPFNLIILEDRYGNGSCCFCNPYNERAGNFICTNDAATCYYDTFYNGFSFRQTGVGGIDIKFSDGSRWTG
ncbi:hypothetical protein [Crocosphaera watsonii]|uniref:hypothetical protein n=1 Tax=Crocosphaera watsonii TaxID=263511 RepID=UPI001EF9DD4A|nr:hypothetical protein [Crocosphaera watsonii]